MAAVRLAVVGATGAVGTTMLKVLSERGFPASEIVPFASERSAGKTVGEGLTVQALSDESIQGFDIAIFSAGASVSRVWAPKFAAAGAVVVDNSSCFRRDPDVPLVVAEVNPEQINNRPKGIIANPNCSTMQCLVVLKPIHAAVGIKRLVVTTMQAVSGTGVAAIDELKEQSRAALAGNTAIEPSVYPKQIAFNVIGAAGNFPDGEDYTDEEQKLVFETKKILGDQDIRVSVTCTRVPVVNGHSESVNVQTKKPLSAEQCRQLLEQAEGTIVQDDTAAHVYPDALTADGRNEVFVGRIRNDESAENCLNLWIVADNLRKGAATNAVQLAELVARES